MWMVEVKFKFLQNISHYCNNIFVFHMHMFIIYVLNLNKLNTTIHSHIIFIIIAYNQNLHFKIHCKTLQKQEYNSFHHNLILQKNHTKVEHRIHYKSMFLCIIKNINPNYSIIPSFVEKNPKTTLKICVISK
jgi:hypothetical protein